LFTEIRGITIQQFIILHKVEKVKELILYDELNLTEISYKLHYSSVAHLSNQFKKITGLTPTFFKKVGSKRRKNLHDV
jgi:AraC-like DNA-binding protein